VKSRVLGPTLLAAGILAGASFTPRVITSWPEISKEIARIARAAMSPAVFPVLVIAVLASLLVTAAILILRGWRNRQRRVGTSRRMRQATRLDRSGYSLDTIARQTGLTQDGVRTVLVIAGRR
jgi:membrane protein implicated in regulation of membrane protease activity